MSHQEFTGILNSEETLKNILSLNCNVSDLKLFNKMILVGGNALTIPLGQRNPVDTAFELGHRLGYRGKNREHLLKFFKSLPDEELTEAMNAYYLELKMEHKGNVFHFPFLPTVQRHTQDAIIPEEPEEMLKKATKLPTLTGMMNRDGLIAYYLDPFVLNHLVEDFYSVVRKIIPMNERIYRTIVNRIKSEYFKNKDVTYNAFPESVDFFTDVYWTRRLYDILPETELSDSPTYVFQFCHDGALNCYKKYYPVLTRWLEGATHDDMLGYCLPFKIDLGSKFSNKKDVKVVNFVCTLLSNFIKTGNPNGKSIRVQWKPSTQKEAYYLQIADIPKLVAGKINESRITFWKQMEKMIEEAESDSDNSDEESESADD